MIDKIEQWIDTTNKQFLHKRQSCIKFSDIFQGFYSTEFLKSAYFVVVDTIPKPDFPEVRNAGLSDFLDLDVYGITYKNTYYIIPQEEENIRLHFHELVHVAQWLHLGANSFLQRYITQVQSLGYNEAPLEKIAYAFDCHFSENGSKIDVPNYIAAKITKCSKQKN
ncbi:hypothetical protein [Photobacterium indicum]|uniref:DUF4157 domain-containing protein n=1 Tax=Photobacterium indicum TaxID=81447 RepID=A0A2T3L2S3_9GAMM|nr:hypothetical protein [Photobacterium indicum]PSV43183.1 hypothetical protein C9J47_23665 [Photobacterium indicum]